jgi:hypothetical protein
LVRDAHGLVLEEIVESGSIKLAENDVVLQKLDEPPARVIWNFWKLTQSDSHYRESGEIDLRDLSV